LSFEQIIGQERAKSMAEAWIAAGRLPHSILICGPAGAGKRRFALELAKGILCREEGVRACDRCVSCHKVDSLLHPDVHMLLPLPPRRGKKNDARILEEMRDAVTDYVQQDDTFFHSTTNIARDHLRLLQREMAYAPVEAHARIGLIFEADCMHPAGANSLLKILEEPPSSALFILVSAAPERMLSTVLSRCQRLSLRRLNRGELREYFKTTDLESERVELAVRLGEGSLQRAGQVARGEVDELRGRVEGFLTAGVRGEDEAYWSMLEELGARSDRGRLEQFLTLCSAYIRDLFLLAYGRGEEISLVDRRVLLEQLRSQMEVEQIEAIAMEIDRAFDYLSRNVNVNLILVDLWRRLGSEVRRRHGTAATGMVGGGSAPR
jgi:DNA polymerase III subunit delta'